MLAKIGRLTKDKEFDLVFKKGRSCYADILGVKASANKLDEARLGILISNKVNKKAVVRNKIRRQARDIVRTQAETIKTGVDFIIIFLPAANNKKHQDIKEAINFCFRKLRLYK